MSDPTQQARLNEIEADLQKMIKNPNLGEKQVAHMRRLREEGEELLAQKTTHTKAVSMMSMASPEEWGRAGTNPGDTADLAFKGIGPNMGNRIRPTSIYQMDKSQINALKQAAQQGTPFRVQLGSKGIEHGFFGGVREKSAITEGGLTPNLLPPVQQFGPNGWFGLPYEINRVANFLPNVAMDGPGVAWFSHTSNGAEAAYTAEGASKPDLTPVVTENYTRPAKVAGRVNITHELLQDAGDRA